MVASRRAVWALAGAAFRGVSTFNRDCEQGRGPATGHSDASQRGAGARLVRAYFVRAPATLPTSRDWLGTLSGLGNADYFWFIAQSDRTLSVEVTALDELKAPSLVKAQPVIGMWALADSGTFPAPANTGLAFNSANLGMTRLDATLQASTAFRLGIFDYRSDGRPDYRYHARVFYADKAVPARARVDGGTAITLRGSVSERMPPPPSHP